MIQKSATEEGLVTYEEFRALVEDGQKADLIDGVIYMASPDSLHANELNLLIAFLMEGYVVAKQVHGRVFFSRVACRVSRLHAPEPDVGYVLPEHAHLVEDNQVNGAPDIAVEIVARESRGRDYGEKRSLYEEAGVSEYWIVDPLQRRCEFLRLNNGRYELVPLEENRIFRSAVIPGFWVNVEWLLAKKLPRAYDCLKEILG